MSDKEKKIGYIEIIKAPMPGVMQTINLGAYWGIGQMIGWVIASVVILPTLACIAYLFFITISAIGAS